MRVVEKMRNGAEPKGWATQPLTSKGPQSLGVEEEIRKGS